MSTIISNIKYNFHFSRAKEQKTSLVGATGRAVGRFKAFFTTKNEKRAAIDSFVTELREKYGSKFANEAMGRSLDVLWERGRSLKLATARSIITETKRLKKEYFEKNYNRIQFTKLAYDTTGKKLNNFLDPLLEKKSLQISEATRGRIQFEMTKQILSHVPARLDLSFEESVKPLNLIPFEPSEIEKMIEATPTFQKAMKNENNK